MRKPTTAVAIFAAGVFAAVVTSVALLTTNAAEVKAQTPPAPCACSRATAVMGTDEVTGVPGPLQSRFGIIHCQCGAATCVTQIPFASVGAPQLFCVK